jgi:hypothetical protein
VIASSGCLRVAVAAIAVGVMVGAGRAAALADEPALHLRAAVIGASSDTALTIELLRWSTDAERAPLLAALAAPPPPPATPPAAGGGRGARGGRGGRGAAPPLSQAARLTGAITAAPTVGFVWGDGPTGYAIKYAWHSPVTNGYERVVLATERRIGAHQPSWPPASRAAADAEFTIIEMRLDAKGTGEGKTSLTADVGLDVTANTLALEVYDTAPLLFKVTR